MYVLQPPAHCTVVYWLQLYPRKGVTGMFVLVSTEPPRGWSEVILKVILK